MDKNQKAIIISGLKDTEFQDLYLRECILAYLEDNDYHCFSHALELIIQSKTSFEEFAACIGITPTNLRKILKNEPSLAELSLILSALGYKFNLKNTFQNENNK